MYAIEQTPAPRCAHRELLMILYLLRHEETEGSITVVRRDCGYGIDAARAGRGACVGILVAGVTRAQLPRCLADIRRSRPGTNEHEGELDRR